MKLIDGKIAKQFYIENLINKVNSLSFTPKLVIVQVGNRADSNAFIKAKKSFAKKINVNEEHKIFPENISQDDLMEEIKKINNDKSVNGIIVQLPLPLHIDADSVIECISREKDVDGLTSYNTKMAMDGHENAIIPATARGIKELLSFYNIDLFNKNVTVVGRSMLVGKPTAMMCLNQNATVTICHSKTKNLKEETRKADILIVAIGKPKFINREYIKENQIIIDIGINRLEDGSLSGDVDFQDVKDIVDMITPVPGGVGQMTVLALFENLIDVCYNLKNTNN